MKGQLNDKFMSTIKVGSKGQIVIPKEVRELFNINPGDQILLLADKTQGIAILSNEDMEKVLKKIMEKENGAK